MTRVIPMFGMACLLAIPAVLRAQNEVGAWRLDVAQSKYSGVTAPKRLTQTFQAMNGMVQNHTEGVAGNGSTINFAYTAKYDGTDARIVGKGAWNGADSVTLKRIDANTIEATYKRGGMVASTRRVSVSSDGKVMTVAAQGTGPDGKPTDAQAVYSKE